jgi:hypothetical protein
MGNRPSHFAPRGLGTQNPELTTNFGILLNVSDFRGEALFERQNMKRVCVFCGSSAGSNPEYARAARRLGASLAARGLGLVFGGGKVGLMGQVAQSVLDHGGEAIGVIPHWMVAKEVALTTVTDLRVVETMHERKMLMADLADGFVAMPGGVGTLDEFFEIWTWGQLGLHAKPFGLLNAGGYYTRLLAFLDHMAAEHFIPDVHRRMVLEDDVEERLLDRMEQYQAPVGDKARWALEQR